MINEKRTVLQWAEQQAPDLVRAPVSLAQYRRERVEYVAMRRAVDDWWRAWMTVQNNPTRGTRLLFRRAERRLAAVAKREGGG